MACLQNMSAIARYKSYYAVLHAINFLKPKRTASQAFPQVISKVHTFACEK